jgi:hypothetical protein
MNITILVFGYFCNLQIVLIPLGMNLILANSRVHISSMLTDVDTLTACSNFFFNREIVRQTYVYRNSCSRSSCRKFQCSRQYGHHSVVGNQQSWVVVQDGFTSRRKSMSLVKVESELLLGTQYFVLVDISF